MNLMQKPPRFRILGIFPRCPFYQSVTAIVIILALIALGTLGIYFLNVWAAVAYLAYSIAWYFLAMPFVMCKYCYFNIKETTMDGATGKFVERLMSLDKWRKTNGIAKHKACGERTTVFMAIIWLLPFVLIFISFFRHFSIVALLALIGFALVLVGNYYYMVRHKCRTCAIQQECHTAFSK